MRRAWVAGMLIAGLVLALPAIIGASGSHLLPPPGVRANPGWISETSGPTNPAKAQPQLFIVARSPARPRPHLPLALFEGLRELAPTSALIWASTAGRGHFDHFKYDVWPPRLSHFRIDHAWEMQPEGRIQQRLLWFTADGWSFDVRVYLGTQQPSPALLASVQAELDRLTLPSK